ncbi:polyphosphate polymerase domain-containing protein [Paenibacillus thermotolerans]|uniref:polyphosphate polymerase domain-containing protein n=1 Tax=Paenibacillus thermotolerans TaxID=3027807 RepID=UPI002367EA11|nr:MULTISPECIES: polyphosphate polymerase domain-containing protein [unclassified Paenibacillus]
MAKEVFTRYEVKYLIPFGTYLSLQQALAPYVRSDDYGGNQGRYRVHSLYFESPDYRIYYETKNRAKYRQKLRMRVYNQAGANDFSYLEIKKKHGNVVNKRRTQLKVRDAYRFIAGDGQGLPVSNEQVLKEIVAFREAYQLAPKVIVSYDRQAMAGIEDPELRITFDHHLMCRRYDPPFMGGGRDEAYFVDPGLVILEVKVSDSVPLWLTRLLSEYGCLYKSVSKYCTSLELLDLVVGGQSGVGVEGNTINVI